MQAEKSLQIEPEVSSTQTKTPIEDMPLNERIKLAEEFEPFAGVEVGWFLDAKDTVDNWCLATVLKVMDEGIEINFDGWSQKYDCVFCLN